MFSVKGEGEAVTLRRLDHEYFMGIALEEAESALKDGEVPVGAVVVYNRVVIGRGRNSVMGVDGVDGMRGGESGGDKGKSVSTVEMRGADPTAHAEIMAIRDAVGRIGGIDNYRLEGADLYVTIEPCVMCAGAIIQARLGRLIYGAQDVKGGAVDSLYKILGDKRFNHIVEVTGGILEEESRGLIQSFFKGKRKFNRKTIKE